MTAVRLAVRLRLACGLVPSERAGEVAVLSPYVVGDRPHRTPSSQTAPQRGPQSGWMGEPGEAEMPACPSTASSKKSDPAPAPGAWPAIVARIADPAADAHRVLYLLEPWPECARIVHRIGGNGTTDQVPRRRQKRSAMSISGEILRRDLATPETYSLEQIRVMSDPPTSLPTHCDVRMTRKPARPPRPTPQAQPHTQPADLRQQPANPTASTKESGSWKT